MKTTPLEKEIIQLRKQLEESIVRESRLKKQVQSLQNLSEHDQVRRELEAERSYFEHLFQGIPEGVVLLDKDDRILDCNIAFEELFQYNKKKIIGKAINDVIVPEHLKKEGLDATNDVAVGKNIQFDTERRAKDGRLIQVSITGRPIDIKGGQTAVIGVYRDITGLKETERRLQQEKEKFVKIVETSPGAICSFRMSSSGTGNYPYASPDIKDVYGFSPEQLMADASPVAKRIHKDDRDVTREDMSQSAKHLTPWYGRYRYNHPEKGMIWVENRMVPEADEYGGTIWYGYVLDVTREKERELREQALREITVATVTTTDLEALINKIRIILEQLIDTTNFYIALYNKETQILSIPYERDEKDNIESWPAEKSVTGLIVTNKKPLLLQKSAILALMDEGIIHQVGNMCEVWLGVPLMGDSGVIGALVVQDYNNPNAYNKESQAVLEFVSHHISMAIQRQQNIEDLRFHSTILDQIRDRVTVTDMDGTIAYVNNAECNALATTREEMIGKNVTVLGKDQRKQKNRRIVLNHTIDKGQWRGEIKTHNHEGDDIILDVRSSLVTNRDGKAIGVCAISRDITEQKKTALQRDYHLRVQQMISKISSEFVGITRATFDHKIDFMLRELGVFMEVDRAYLFCFLEDRQYIRNTHEWCADGIESQMDSLHNFPVSGFSWWTKKIFNDKIIHIPDIEKMPSDAKNEQIEFQRQGIKSLLAVPVYDSFGIITGFFGFDAVRARKKWSGYQIGFLRILANTITDAMKMVDIEKNLVQAKERAEESDRLKSAFLANVSHEIRTPMNAILGFLSLLKEPRLEEEQRSEYIGVVNKSGQRLLDTINDIMELSKIEAGQVKVQQVEVNVSELMKYQYDLFLPQIRDKGLYFRLSENIPAKYMTIVSDQHKLEGILINLINNALKFTTSGFIEFGTYIVDEDIVFYVKDTGIGIPEDKQEAVFERFVQADLTLARKHEGTGLGLSIVKAYLELLNGRIWLESKPGKGSTFFFSIPLSVK